MSSKRATALEQGSGQVGPRARHWRFVSLRWKLLLGFTVVFTPLTGGIFYWFYSFTNERVVRRVHDDLLRTLTGAVAGVDVEQLLALARDGEANAAGFSDDPRFEDQLDWLDHVHGIESQAWPYLYRVGPARGEIEFIVDLYARYDPDKAAHFRQAYLPPTPFLLRGLSEQVVDTDPETDEWGTWISAAAPLTDASGNRVAALGVDFDALHVIETQRLLRSRVYLAFSVSYVLLLLLVYLIAGFFSRPLARLAHAAESLSEGRYDRDAEIFPRQRIADEIGVLAGVFETMAANVVRRERSLRREVDELRIEIDEGMRQQAVSEIVETDFFRDLQSKAARLKQRGGSKTGNDDRS